MIIKISEVNEQQTNKQIWQFEFRSTGNPGMVFTLQSYEELTRQSDDEWTTKRSFNNAHVGTKGRAGSLRRDDVPLPDEIKQRARGKVIQCVNLTHFV